MWETLDSWLKAAARVFQRLAVVRRFALAAILLTAGFVIAAILLAAGEAIRFNDKNGSLGSAAQAMSSLAGTCAAAFAACLVIKQILDQQAALNRQMENATLQARLLANSAMVDAQNHRIAEAKAIIETLRKGSELTIAEQAVPPREEIFVQYAAALKRMIPEPKMRDLASEQLIIWKSAALQREEALETLEELARAAEQIATSGTAGHDNGSS